MDSISTDNYIIHFNEACYIPLNKLIAEHNYSNIFVLVDANTHEHCLPYFFENIVKALRMQVSIAHPQVWLYQKFLPFGRS